MISEHDIFVDKHRLRAAIEEARTEYAEGRGIPFDQAAVKKIATAGRRLMSERDRKR